MSHRTALNGLVREIDIPVDGTDRDLEIFMQENADHIVNILRGTLETQTFVDFNFTIVETISKS